TQCGFLDDDWVEDLRFGFEAAGYPWRRRRRGIAVCDRGRGPAGFRAGCGRPTRAHDAAREPAPPPLRPDRAVAVREPPPDRAAPQVPGGCRLPLLRTRRRALRRRAGTGCPAGGPAAAAR